MSRQNVKPVHPSAGVMSRQRIHRQRSILALIAVN
jgi:hypothetical protein